MVYSSKLALIFFSKDDVDRYEPWKKALKEVLPDLDVRPWQQPGNIGEIEFALVWKPPPGMLATFPNLRAVFSVGAGVDSLLNDPELPAEVPVCRMVDESLTQGMVEYSILHVLRHHRNQTLLANNIMSKHFTPWMNKPRIRHREQQQHEARHYY